MQTQPRLRSKYLSTRVKTVSRALGSTAGIGLLQLSIREGTDGSFSLFAAQMEW